MNGVWYAKIVDQKTGNQLLAVSTGQTDRNLAVLTVSLWLVEGIPQASTESSRRSQREGPLYGGRAREVSAVLDVSRVRPKNNAGRDNVSREQSAIFRRRVLPIHTCQLRSFNSL